MNGISARRRTDPPDLYWRWFMNRIAAGFCEWANPFDARQTLRPSLAPADVVTFVSWTRAAASGWRNAGEPNTTPATLPSCRALLKLVCLSKRAEGGAGRSRCRHRAF
jgi:hypothetical protein